eukprot:TRINITY_DN7402_c1_g1_i1.p1 TRINITY_DN7402_c1_g1~~TRINITY_DN7402_c1_g1_i1.p1  ORF type:complete len:158 (+),score=14.40 TRINITY_DN7402_c1_g1_i1:38-475(+)
MSLLNHTLRLARPALRSTTFARRTLPFAVTQRRSYASYEEAKPEEYMDRRVAKEFDAGPRYLGGEFGTVEKPVLVPSFFPSRIVGCVGGEGEHVHDLIWHEVREGKPLMCLSCGQVFVHQRMEKYREDNNLKPLPKEAYHIEAHH